MITKPPLPKKPSVTIKRNQTSTNARIWYRNNSRNNNNGDNLKVESFTDSTYDQETSSDYSDSQYSVCGVRVDHRKV